MGDIILTMEGIDKSFPGVHALDHVQLEIRKGEVLALMGENGAGKSTLMKVLTGIYKKDAGTILYEGKEVEFHSAREAQEAPVEDAPAYASQVILPFSNLKPVTFPGLTSVAVDLYTNVSCQSASTKP